jgi:hypothetical protein
LFEIAHARDYGDKHAAFQIRSAAEFLDGLRTRATLDSSNTVSVQQRPGVGALVSPAGNRVVPRFTLVDATSFDIQVARENAPRTPAALARDFGVSLPEISLSMTRSFEEPQRVGVSASVHKSCLDDAGAVRVMVEELLSDDLLREADRLALVGSSGTGNEFDGVVAQVSQSEAKGANSYTTSLIRAAVQCRKNGNAVATIDAVLHSDDVQKLVLTSDYLTFAEAWRTVAGGDVVVSNLITSGAPLVGSLAEGVFWLQRSGVEIGSTLDHASNFTAGIATVTAEMRATVRVVRPEVLCKVTGW